MQCSNLQNVDLGDNVTSIEESAFRYCTSLTQITIPQSVVEIGEYAFASSGLTNVIFEDAEGWQICEQDDFLSGVKDMDPEILRDSLSATKYFTLADYSWHSWRKI